MQKLNDGVYEGRHASTDASGRRLSADSLDDLQLAEVNYICMVEAIDEKTSDARSSVFAHCLDHTSSLFQQGEYLQAINTTFVA